MTTNSAPRLPAVPPLSSILPAGTESGKEFGRIVGLLLFNDARRNGLEFNLFDDSSGDYEGLDSFAHRPKSAEVIGYQYKFFPCPLSDDHRQQIRLSLESALARSKELKLEKWVLVTPDDLKNSGRRDGSGDVEWFDRLRNAHKDRVEVEHIGHSKLLDLFLQAPYLCLFYYPLLIPSGESRRRSIREIRVQYDENMRSRYGKIEFVGMSVYKEEASRRIPLEDIYIPLSVVPERAADETDLTPRVDPTTFISPGARTVILGDPGSGKSTLLAFLALVGTTATLQQRCGLIADQRLTIVVTLRRYADELKTRNNLPLLEYILEVARADFNLSALTTEFYEYYVESGQAIILFDGLDELPGSGFKSTVRERIESFITTYPANTIIVTSRLVGYEAEIRFDDSWGHFRVAKLRISEIDRFISDWYAVRMEDPVEKQLNAADLIKVVSQPDNESIRALARNPLLLTIVALVHRIDAVLPDQRVVLYQKCTETLLNTWYKAKRRDEETVKGRIERRNRLRIEAIAYWMHTKSIAEQGRAVVRHDELLGFLTSYIVKNEKIRDIDEPAEDQAEIFLEFIKKAAGLLIEAGDGLYSFIHLTFQEYLCATHLAAFGEIGGAQSIWDELKGDLQNPRWREVVRLLIASLRSIPGQKFFIDKLVDEPESVNPRDTALLLIGLLRDAIEPAEERAGDIMRYVLICLQTLNDGDDIRLIESGLSNWLSKDKENEQIFERVLKEQAENASSDVATTLILICTALGAPEILASQKEQLEAKLNPRELSFIHAFVIPRGANTEESIYSLRLDCMSAAWTLFNPESNAAAAIAMCASILLNPTDVTRRLLTRELTVIADVGYGPHHDNGLNLVAFALATTDVHPALKLALTNSLSEVGQNKRERLAKSSIDRVFSLWLKRTKIKKNKDDENHHVFRRRVHSTLDARATQLGISTQKIGEKHGARERTEFSDLHLLRRSFEKEIDFAPRLYWEMLLSSDVFTIHFMDVAVGCLELNHREHWTEALKTSLKQLAPQGLKKYFDIHEWKSLNIRLEAEKIDREDIEFAAWLIVFDVWVWSRHGYEDVTQSPISALVMTARKISNPIIDLALSLRDVCQGIKDADRRFAQLMSNRSSDIVQLLRGAGWLKTASTTPVMTRKIEVRASPTTSSTTKGEKGAEKK